VGQRVLHGEDPAPRLAVEHEAVPLQAEGPPHLFDLIDEAVKLPQRVVVRPVAECGAELIVVVVLNPRRREEAVASFQIFMGGARPAVEQEHAQLRVVSDPLRPNLESAGWCVDRHHAHTAGECILSL
jgi:hypothetical protein